MKQYRITADMFRGEDDTLPDCVLPEDDIYNPKNMLLTDRADYTYTKPGLEELNSSILRKN